MTSSTSELYLSCCKNQGKVRTCLESEPKAERIRRFFRPLACLSRTITTLEEEDEEQSKAFKQWLRNISTASSESETTDAAQEFSETCQTISTTQSLLRENEAEIRALQATLAETLKEMKLDDQNTFREDGLINYGREDHKPSFRCNKCGGPASPVNLVSHSSSEDALIKLFATQFPSLQGKEVLMLDIGSGLGNILFAIFALTPPSTSVVGLEINEALATLTEKVVERNGMQGRVSIRQGDLREQEVLLKRTDVVFFNNAFEYFVPEEEQRELWGAIRKNLKKGTILVTNPPLEEMKPEWLGFPWNEWVEPFRKQATEDDDLLKDAIVEGALGPTDENFRVYSVQ